MRGPALKRRPLELTARRLAGGGRPGWVAAAAALAWVSLPGPAAAETAYVSISNNAFSPDSVRVQMGPPETGFPHPHAHVQFLMADQGTQHNVTFDDPRIPPSPNLSAGQIHDAVFTVAGTFAYGCTIHPSMRGTVVVTDMPVTNPTTTTTTMAPAAVPSTAAPTTAPPVSNAVTPQTTSARAAPSTLATTAPTTPTTVPTTAAPITSTSIDTTSTTVPDSATPEAADLPSGDRELSVGASRDNDASSGTSWPLVVLFVVVAGAAAIFGTHRVRRRPTPPDA